MEAKAGAAHSSVDLSAPTFLLPRVRVPSTPSILKSFVFVLYLSTEKNEKRPAGFGPFIEKMKAKLADRKNTPNVSPSSA